MPPANIRAIELPLIRRETSASDASALLTPRRVMAATSLLFVVTVIGAPLIGWPRTVRGSVVLGVPFLIGCLCLRPWTWGADDWRRTAQFELSNRQMLIAA